MLFFANKSLTLLICLIFITSFNDLAVADNSTSGSVSYEGYADVVYFKSQFIAVGTDGRIDCIAKSGERISVNSSVKNNLNCAVADEKMIVVGGEHGTILYSFNGTDFLLAESGTDMNINGIAIRNGLIIAGTNNGEVLLSENGKSWNSIQTKVQGNIISLSANNSFFMGVTDAGEIMKSTDGKQWEIKDYNKEYAGYNPYSKFEKVLATPNSIVIIGTHDDGSPSILFSTLGNVWNDRTAIYHDDQGAFYSLSQNPNGVTYDSDRDQYILACNKGELFTLPSCTKCNSYAKISEADFHAISYEENYLLIVGDKFSVYIQKL